MMLGGEPEGEIAKVSPERVAWAFSHFINTYVKFRRDNGLGHSVPSIHEVCNSMTDKHGRICRHVKHAERKDPKPDFPEVVAEELTGYLVFALMVAEKYGVNMERGMAKELRKAIEQHSK